MERVSDAGEAKSKLPGHADITELFPAFLPDGRHYVATRNRIGSTTESGLWLESMDGPEARYARQLYMGHPARMKAITAGKKKSDRLDARTIADLLRCDLLPKCYVLPPKLRDLRRLLRYRNLVVQQSVRMQNKMAGLLMESGTAFNKEKLHQKKYFADLMKSLQEVPESVKDLLRMSRGAMEMFESTQKQLIQRLLSEPALQPRVERLIHRPVLA